MRANTDRSLARSFDAVADLYDAVRPRFDAALVERVLGRTGRAPHGLRALEIGAGTGQLTDALLTLGCHVTAIEPGPNMARALESRTTVLDTTFERAQLDGELFDVVISSNAFHWVDPSIGHAKVVEHLVPGGSLVLLWNFPLPSSAADQLVWNEVVAGLMPDAVIERTALEQAIDESLVDGRGELRDRGLLEPVEWGWEVDSLELTALERLRLSASYASSTAVTESELHGLATELEGRGITTCRLENRTYWLIARPVLPR